MVLPGSTTPVQLSQSASRQKVMQRNYLGTSKLIKLPYIIGTEEYKKHPFAGVVYRGEDELEQLDLYQEEMDKIKVDKERELEMLEKNKQDMQALDNF
jgi:hypothetical protein